MVRELYKDKFIDKYLFKVDYELAGKNDNVYTFEFWVTRCDKLDRGNIMEGNHSATITIVDKTIQDQDPLIYTILLLHPANDGGNLASIFLQDAAKAEGLL